jgi:putative radical SAM-modified peptide
METKETQELEVLDEGTEETTEVPACCTSASGRS